jgi:chemotaxis protein CheY-P-specific phosphatase CheC
MGVSTRDTLVGTATRVFEQAAFMFADEVEIIENQLDIGVSLSYSGENSGTIELWTVGELALTIANNLLGETGELSGDKLIARQTDAVKEMLNMIAGNLITDLYGTEPIYNLAIPEKIEIQSVLSEIPEDAAKLNVEGLPVVILVK